MSRHSPLDKRTCAVLGLLPEPARRRSHDRGTSRDDVPEPVRRADTGRRGRLGGDVSVLPPLRPGAARGRGTPALDLQRDALPGADAGVRHDHRRVVLPLDRPVPGPRVPDPHLLGIEHRVAIRRRSRSGSRSSYRASASTTRTGTRSSTAGRRRSTRRSRSSRRSWRMSPTFFASAARNSGS
jgi:hypothetical protein